jgi:hypothetical protein
MGKQEGSWEDNLSDTDKASLAAIRETNRKTAETLPKPEPPVGPSVPSPHSTKVLQARQAAAFTSGDMNLEDYK